ncbi:immunity protein YezG family protein [Listeria booriae]|uniref:immunity protein YezG family protein n=1 Tax=Listeria booriae TaxID=1552123 RepID=UPI001627CA0C|nr:immunity protein YezG family protein [Listeria booriae]MBC1891426.1 DUF600 family protein [Listeria booriae]
MEFEKKLNTIYQKIAQKISDMIPDSWEKFYFNGEVKDGDGGVYFFFQVDSLGENIYSHYIPKIYGIEKSEYNKSLHDLFLLTKELQQVFIDNNQEAWFSVNMIVSSEGKLKVHFDYTDWTKTEYGPSTRVEYFLYKFAQVLPSNEADLAKLREMEKYEA